ncbi:MAG: metallophosphoesterase [Christensenellales bacterium]|jgi:predicted MPP superfamily phosphohydrolase|nr:metallophosphoesterase [Faecalibacterium sp.]MEE0020644.1 metallophosphoesterase [Christensenellales bacterium]MEE0324751.1 metallophosphoesterase [Christensenellales bacterium]
MMQKNTITVTSDKITQPLTFAFAADFHNGDADEALSLMRGCDAILIGGDLVNRHSRHGWRNAARFLDLAPRVAPTFYNLGNHERLLPDIAEYLPLVQKSNVTVLDDCFVDFRGITLGGVSSARKMPGMPPVRAQMDAKKPFLQAMAARDGFKLLLCHHPEYFAPLVQGLDIDLTLAGHAHGGQVRIGSQGIYSPGQGLFPKLTSGFYFDDKLFISRGMTNSACAPRLWCPCELVMVRLLPNRAI